MTSATTTTGSIATAPSVSDSGREDLLSCGGWLGRERTLPALRRGARCWRCWGTCFLRERAARLQRKELARSDRARALRLHPGFAALQERISRYSDLQRGACSLADLLLMPSARELLESGQVDSVTRLEVSFLGLAPEVVISLETKDASARATVVTVRESVRPGRLLQDPALPALGRAFWARTATTRTMKLDSALADEVMRSSGLAPDCATRDLLDGTSFLHSAAEKGVEHRATWFSPGLDHPMQLHIVKLYQRVSGVRCI